jgi:predicted dehydrogenase
MGNQRRSWPVVKEAVEFLRSGGIGRVHLAQAWYFNTRPTIGRGNAVAVPEGLDYDLWQGPAPRKPFRDNYLHYNWHWFWHWGNGELGNNGIHMLDVCRWGLGADFPVEVSSTGGRLRWDDDQETPDTNTVAYKFEGRRMITWEGLSCSRPPEGAAMDVLFHGEGGSLAIRGNGYTVQDPKGKKLKEATGPGGEAVHIANFLEAVRTGSGGAGKLNSPIAEGHRSTLMCHLGNIAFRVGRTLKCRPADGHILDDKDAEKLWSKDYEPGWEPKA